MPSSIKKICSFSKKRKCARKTFIIFVTLSDLNKTSKPTVPIKCVKVEVFYYKSDMHNCMCDQCDSAFCALQLTVLMKPNSCILLYCCACLYSNTILIQAGWTTVPCPAINLSILICKSSARTKESGISVALKTPLEIRLGICTYKTSLLHRPDVYTGLTPSCPPTFYNKIAPMLINISSPKLNNQFFKISKHKVHEYVSNLKI